MPRINLNKFAQEVAAQEGLKKQMDIAQIKEVIRVTLKTFHKKYESWEVLEVIARYKSHK